MKDKKISASWINLVLATLKDAGFDTDRLCKLADIPVTNLAEPFIQLDEHHLKNLWQAASVSGQDKHIGLVMGNAKLEGPAGAALYGLLFCNTFREQTALANTITSYFTSSFKHEFIDHNEGLIVKLCFDKRYKKIPKVSADSILSFSYSIINNTFLGQKTPKEVYFSTPEPKDITRYREIFKCPIIFDHEFNGFLFDHDIVNAQQPTANEILFDLYRKNILKIIDRENASTISEQINTYIRKNTPINDDINLDNISQIFNVSKSTVKRRIREDGTTFSDILNNVRKDMAKELIELEQMSIQEIGFELGYKETSAFFRAFKRWYGCTPGQYIAKAC